MALRIPRVRWLLLLALASGVLFVVWPSVVPRSSMPQLFGQAAPSNQPRCWFNFDMRLLRQDIPDVVGECLENSHYNPENGDTVQRTTGGLMVWRRADRTTAFTDGNRTWARGPNGLESRWNAERFGWELQPEAPSSTAVARPTEPAAAATRPAGQPTPTPRAVVVSTPQAQVGGALGSVAAAAIPSTSELIASATELVLVNSLKSSGLPVQNVTSLNAATDPDKLLGKPGQYSSKIVWRDQRAGSEDCAIELFADEASMRARLQALQSLPTSSPQYTPYVSGDPARKALIKLPKGLAPDQAQAYQRWLATLR